jgi:MFS family permease
MMVPVGRLILVRTVPRGQLVNAMARMTLPALVGPAIGPLLGGFIVTYASWQWIFFINVPIGLIGLFFVLRLIPNLKEARPDPFDLAGFAFSAVSLACLMFGLEHIGRGEMAPGAVVGTIAVGLVFGWLYLRRARRVARPVLDPTLFRHKSYLAAVIGGSLFRVGVGAVPFLVPVMLQIGFGLSAFQSGSLTFIAAVGALLMKPMTAPIFRRFGFRSVLLVNALLSGAILISYGFFKPETAHWFIMATLLVGGLFRSLQFSGLNTLAYAEISQAETSRANTLSSVMQQLSLSAGVAVGAMVLHLTQLFASKGALTAGDFLPAFLTVGLLSCVSALFFLRLPRDAGDEISGHRAALSKAADVVDSSD